MTNSLHDSRSNLYHLARTAGDETTARNVWSAVDRIEGRMAAAQRAVTWPDDDETDDRPRKGHRTTELYRACFDVYLRSGPVTLTEAERRALSADNDASAGSAVLPETTAEKVLLAVNNSLVMRQLATKVDVLGAQSIGVPEVVNNPADGDWTTELATGDEDSTMSFGKRELVPRPCAKRIKASRKLLRNARNAERLIGERLAYVVGLTFEKAMLTGDGVAKPLGVFTASSDGIPTTRDVSTGNSSTSVGGDGLYNALYSLKERWLNSASLRWLCHRDMIKQARELKGTLADVYLFQPATIVGQPDLLCGVPVLLSEHAPNTFTTGQYVGLVGDLSQYWCADSGGITIQRLDELYVISGQIGFICRFESDGQPAIGEAFARVKLA